MKNLALIMSALSLLLLVSTAICGFWIKSNNVTAASSLNFHIMIAISSVVLTALTLVILVCQLLRK